ncbi:MAG: cell division protein FtsZ [Chloroflexota bacterium]|jgi:cell division protein FtsZ|nr:cell division protein FtsZ [Chloroflexota bacterium]MDP6507463.1 cell division protein FtsZ [Chloroflexota bacterium]MDP6757981.1 cell division protein FtsZ [Chloroflexota bacterium]
MDALAQIKVIGVGGGGSNAVDRMIRSNIAGLEFITVNTDAQALMRSLAPTRIRMGDKATKGLGSGGDPNLGEKAAEESSDDIADALRGADMVFLATGLGGGTGTGGSPIIADIAADVGALTVAVVTRPFEFEGANRAQIAEDGIAKLTSRVDTVITIPNDKILEIADQKMPITDAFRLADDVLRQAIQGISDLITQPGLINLDFNDVRAIMTNAGSALMALGQASGEDRAVKAIHEALHSPLLDISIDGASGVLLNFTGGLDLTLFEVNEAATIVSEAADPNANIIFGAVIDEAMESEIKVTVIATGFHSARSWALPGRRGAAFRGTIGQLGAETERGGGDADIPTFLRRRGQS